MTNTNESGKNVPEQTHAQKFDALLGTVLSVSKKEVERRDVEWHKARTKKREGKKAE